MTDTTPEPTAARLEARGTSRIFRGCTELDGPGIAPIHHGRKPHRPAGTGRGITQQGHPKPETAAESLAGTRALVEGIGTRRAAEQEATAQEARAEKERARLEYQRGLRQRAHPEGRVPGTDAFRGPAGQLSEYSDFLFGMGKEVGGDALEFAVTQVLGGVVTKSAGPLVAAIVKRGGYAFSWGSGEYTLYFAYRGGNVRYIGITKNFTNRYFQHLRKVVGREIQPIVEKISAEEALGSEQLLLEKLGFLGYAKDPASASKKIAGSLENKYFSISESKKPQFYKRATDAGRRILRGIGWDGF